MPRGIPNAGYRRTKNQMNGPANNVNFQTSETISNSKFTINQRFDFIQSMVEMVASGEQMSLIITGPGGLGKTYTVMESLNDCGFTDVSTLEDGVTCDDSYVVIKGHTSPRGLFRLLWENNDKVIVLDDCDSALKDSIFLNILKGALDSYSRRIISWRSMISSTDDMPQTFEFTGRIIFISNMSVNAIDQAIITRSMVVDLSMTTEQKIERMMEILLRDDFMPHYSIDVKQDALDLIDEVKDSVKELSLRTLIQVLKIRTSVTHDWKSLAEYAICG